MWISSIAAGDREEALGRGAEGAGGGEGEHRAHALAARQQRVAHRLLEAGGARAAGEKRSSASAASTRSRRSSGYARVTPYGGKSARRAATRIGGGGLAGAAVGLLDRLLRELARLGGERGGAPLLELLAALQLGGDRPQALGDLAQAGHPAGSRSRTIAPSTPLMNLGSVGAAVLLGDLDRLVDRHLVRGLPLLDLEQRDPHHVQVQRRDAVDGPVAAQVFGDRVVEFFAGVLDAFGQFAGQRFGVGHQLLERAAGHVPLIAGEDGVTALVGAAHRIIVSGGALGRPGALSAGSRPAGPRRWRRPPGWRGRCPRADPVEPAADGEELARRADHQQHGPVRRIA